MITLFLVAGLAGLAGFFVGRMVGFQPVIQTEFPKEIKAYLAGTLTKTPSVTYKPVYLTEEHEEKVAEAAKNQS